MTFLYRVVDGGKNFEPLNLGPATHIIYRDAREILNPDSHLKNLLKIYGDLLSGKNVWGMKQ